ncbi:MAG: hypothetical protein WC654_07545 [Patescibacteria group bacterium]
MKRNVLIILGGIVLSLLLIVLGGWVLATFTNMGKIATEFAALNEKWGQAESAGKSRQRVGGESPLCGNV